VVSLCREVVTYMSVDEQSLPYEIVAATLPPGTRRHTGIQRSMIETMTRYGR
jgi:hypothetical protein